MNTKLKKAAMKKAQEEGWTLSAVLNHAARAFIEDRFEIEILPRDQSHINRIRKEIADGKFIAWEKVKRELAEKRSRANSKTESADKFFHKSKKTAPQTAIRYGK